MQYGAEPSSQMQDEQCLIRQAQADPTQFGPLYEHYLPRVYRYCLRRIGSVVVAEDITSIVFTRVISHLSSYRGVNGTFAAWLFRIAHNVIANYRRDQAIEVSLDTVAEQMLIDPNGSEFLDGVLAAEQLRCVSQLIAALPDDQRELLALRITAGLSVRETALVIGKSEGAVRVAFHRIIQQLRDHYAQLQGESENE